MEKIKQYMYTFWNYLEGLEREKPVVHDVIILVIIILAIIFMGR